MVWGVWADDEQCNRAQVQVEAITATQYSGDTDCLMHTEERCTPRSEDQGEVTGWKSG